MNKLIIMVMCFVSLILPVFAVTIPSEVSYKTQARLSLKNYGLVNCLYYGLKKEQNITVDDIGKSAGIYGHLGQGFYNLLQDDDLNILHNPYKTVVDFIKKKREFVSSNMKDGSTNLTHQCLTVFNSLEYSELINNQDPYMIKWEQYE